MAKTDGACCAHLKVSHKPVPAEDGGMYSRWTCDLCGHVFMPGPTEHINRSVDAAFPESTIQVSKLIGCKLEASKRPDLLQCRCVEGTDPIGRGEDLEHKSESKPMSAKELLAKHLGPARMEDAVNRLAKVTGLEKLADTDPPTFLHRVADELEKLREKCPPATKKKRKIPPPPAMRGDA